MKKQTNKYKGAYCLWICSSINQTADIRGEWMASMVKGEGGRRGHGRGKVWQSLTVGTKDPGCFGADGERGQWERGRGREGELPWQGDEGTTDPFSLRISPLGERKKCRKGAKEKKRIWKEHERKKSSLDALQSSLFPSLPPSRTSLNLILNPLQFPPRDSILSFPVSILFHSLAFILSVFPSCASMPYCEIMPMPEKKISINCLLFHCINEWVAFFFELFIL